MTVIQIFDQTAPLVSGYSMRSKSITDALAALGVPLKVFSSPIFSYRGEVQEIDGVPYYRSAIRGWDLVKKVPVLKESMVMESLKRRVSAAIDKDVQLIDAHSSVLNGFVGARLAREHGIRFIYEVRAFWEDAAVDQGKTKEGSLRYRFTRHMETEVINKADKVTVICEGLKSDLLERGIEEDKIVVIPNGVDAERFRPQAPDPQIVEQHGLEGFRVVGFIGTFFEFEGLPLLVEAAERVLKAGKQIRVLLVGTGRDEKKLKKMVAEKGLEEHIRFTGRVPHSDILRYYSVMDLLVYPRLSRRITELVTPLKPLEAMAMRKAVIGSDVGGIRELVNPEKTGLLFRRNDAGELAEKICYVLERPAQMEAIREQARQYVQSERNWLRICQKYLSTYAELGVGLP